jgi:L-threonylcarbamoyladenylate synthase
LRGRVDRAADAALEGELVIFPTDTVYGIGTRPDRGEATGKIFEAKRRPRELELPILMAENAQADDVGVIDDRARSLIDAFWPGALTIVVPRAERSLGWELGGDRRTIGVRRPANRTALEILERTGPLAVTSANISGDEHPRPEDLPEVFGDSVSVYVIDDRPIGGVASTVVDLAHGDARLLRKGAVAASDLVDVLGAQIDSQDP